MILTIKTTQKKFIYFKYNLYNNYGIVGLIHTPTARIYDEGVHGITVYDGTPNQTVTLSSNPYDWFEASFFYTNVQDRPYCYDFSTPFCNQDFKDKGFNAKFLIRRETNRFPAIAIGFRDMAGTGLFEGEYLVASKRLNSIDFTLGLGWGTMSKDTFSNPLKKIDNYLLNF